MWKGQLVIDAVAHAYSFGDDNRAEACPPDAYRNVIGFLYTLLHAPLESTEPGYLLSLEEFSANWDAEAIAHVFFEESDVDVIAYHGVEIAGFFRRGSSPWSIGVELKRAYPDRVLLYAPVDPLKGPQELEAMAAKAAECPVDGFKFYPSNGVIDPASQTLLATMYDDRERAFPFFEQARALGVDRIAIHKALPVGPGPLTKDRIDDVSSAALAFPDLQFEVVHSGWAFLEDCALQLQFHGNIWANLESVVNFVVRQPRRFAHVIGTLMRAAGPDRILFGTGATGAHPQPILDAFTRFEMPQDLREGYNYPALDDAVKAQILGANMARLHGLDASALAERIATDEWAGRRRDWLEGPAAPWSHRRESLAGAAA
jgi:predicted TIM-barrel fold metal-dependent hydrolase